MSIQVLWIIRFIFFYLKPDAVPIYNAALIMYDQALLFLDGLMVWLYVRTLLRPAKNFNRIWLHFIPFGIAFLYSTFVVIFREQEIIDRFNNNIELLKLNQSDRSIPEVVITTFLIGLNNFYLIRSVKITSSYNRRLKENLSNIDNLTINWVKTFQNLWIILFVIPLTVFFANSIYHVVEHISLGYSLIVVFVASSVVFNFYLLEQVYKPVSIFKNELSIPKDSNREEKQQQINKLLKLLSEKEYFLDEDLSLGQLAKYMGLKPSELTEVIKFSTYENFYDLINTYRIESIKKKLVESNDQIIQLAYQNGFRSKSTFNKIFKDKTGMTPKAYRVSVK